MTSETLFNDAQTPGIEKLEKRKLQMLNCLELGLFCRISTGFDQNREKYQLEVKWINVVIFIYLHIAGIYGFLITKTRSTLIIGWTIGILAGFGTTVGAHRLFTHRTFRANQKLRVILLFLQTLSGQHPILQWARDHRAHHKYTDTNADPYNSRRGFFFSHVGWLMVKKHRDVIEQGNKIDMSDLEKDPIMQFQKK